MSDTEFAVATNSGAVGFHHGSVDSSISKETGRSGSRMADGANASDVAVVADVADVTMWIYRQVPAATKPWLHEALAPRSPRPTKPCSVICGVTPA